MNIIRRAMKKYNDNGMWPLFKSGLNYSIRQTGVYDRLIDMMVEETHSILPEKEIKISYNGIRSAPYSDHITACSGNATTGKRIVNSFTDVQIDCRNRHLSNPPPKILKNSFALRLEDLNKKNAKGYFNIQNGHSETIVQNKPAFLIFFRWSDAYAHWNPEILTQLRYIEHIPYNRKDINIVFVAPRGLDKELPWREESLRLLDYYPDFIVSEENAPVFTSQAYFPNYVPLVNTGPPYPPPEDLRWVRKRATQNMLNKNKQKYDRIYVSRQNAKRRVVDNIDEVYKVLNDHGFELVDPGNLKFESQVNLFSNADLVVGPHGAGLMNVMFGDNPTLIELVQNSSENQHPFILSNLMDINYDYIPCNVVEESDKRYRHKNLTVNVDKLQQAIDQYG